MLAHRRLAAALVAIAIVVAACSAGGTPTPTASSPVASPTLFPAASASPAATVDPTAQPSPGPLAWSSIAPGGDQPPPREDHTWTVDESGEVAYLFGGRDGATDYGDLWAYDLPTDAWRRVSVDGTAPAARFGHEAAWVPGHGLVVFGGQAGSTFFGDLWRFDPATGRWEELPAAGAAPVARYGSCSAVGSDGRLWISHGFTENGVRFDDTRAYDFSARGWSDETPAGELPIKRCLHVCWWTADDRLALYGGQTNGTPTLGDLWAYPAAGASAGWASLGEPLALSRNLVAAAPVGDTVVLFGGRGEGGVALDALHQVATDLSEWEELAVVGDGPSPRWAATLVHDQARGRLLLFGGRDASTANAETWALPAP